MYMYMHLLKAGTIFAWLSLVTLWHTANCPCYVWDGGWGRQAPQKTQGSATGDAGRHHRRRKARWRVTQADTTDDARLGDGWRRQTPQTTQGSATGEAGRHHRRRKARWRVRQADTTDDARLGDHLYHRRRKARRPLIPAAATLDLRFALLASLAAVINNVTGGARLI